MIPITSYGQSGFRFNFNEFTVLIDPYLSDSCSKIDGPHMARKLSIKIHADKITDANLILISHIHNDHCDIETLVPISKASPQSIFIGPNEVINKLRKLIDPKRLTIADHEKIIMNSELTIFPVPAAHKEFSRDKMGHLKSLGYVLEYKKSRIYHSGDTILNTELINHLIPLLPIESAFIPVNECTYMRDRQGIIANMSIRDAFAFAELLKVKTLIPMHWDMFASNGAYREEIELLYNLIKPNFNLSIYPDNI